MTYVLYFFAFLFSFMLCASESVGDGYIEEIIQQKTLRVLYIDDATVNLKMTRKAVETYNAQNTSSQIELFTRSHGNNLKRSELETIDMVWCDIQMPGFTGDLVLANLREQHPDFEHPPFIAITSESEYHDSDEEISHHARDRHFIAGRDKIKTQHDIRVVLEVYYSWLEKQKEKTYFLSFTDKPASDDEQTRGAWKISDEVNEDVDIEKFVEAYSPRSPPEKHTDDDLENLSKKHKSDSNESHSTPNKRALTDPRKVSPYKADLLRGPTDGDETELSCLRKCLKRLGDRFAWLSELTSVN